MMRHDLRCRRQRVLDALGVLGVTKDNLEAFVSMLAGISAFAAMLIMTVGRV